MLKYDKADTIVIHVHPQKAFSTFSSAAHHPIVVGYTDDGIPLYFAEMLSVDESMIAIRDGTDLRKTRIRWRYSDKIVTKRISSCSRTDVLMVPILKYDPYAYELGTKYMSKVGMTEGMDATGPFSWKFHRKLPRDLVSVDEPSIHAPRLLWAELEPN